jgi:FkbM family methyltransferase
MTVAEPIRATARRVRRWGRALAGTDILYSPELRCSVVRLGNEGAAFGVQPELLSAESVVYSVGIGTNVSFDLGLLSGFVREVQAFDPTPRSLEWVAKQQLPTGLRIHPYGVSDFDGIATFAPPVREDHVSYRMAAETGPDCVEAPVFRLTTLMRMLGHESIDLLKLDIEGGEYAVLDDVLKCGIAVRQICVEFHHRWPGVGVAKTRDAVAKLSAAGYRIFDVLPSGEEFSLLKGERTSC